MLLVKPAESPTTPFNRLKQAPGPATPKTITLWVERLEWLGGLIDPDPLLEASRTPTSPVRRRGRGDGSERPARHRPASKTAHAVARPPASARMRCRDELVEMMLRRIRRAGGREGATRGAARPTPGHRGSPDWHLRSGIETAQAHDTDVAFGSRVRTLLSEHGGVDALAAQCETVSAWHRNNDLPLLWPIHARHRACCSGLSTCSISGRRHRTAAAERGLS